MDSQNRARAEGLNVDYRVGDAEALAYDDATFDAAISTYGVMFASHPEAAAAELARVTRPGGRLVLTTWRPDSSVFGMFRVLREFMPPPPDPAPPSPFEWVPRDMCGRPAGFKVASQRSMGAVRLRSCVRLLRAVYDREPRWVPRMAFQNNQPALRCLCRALDVCHSSARPIAIFSYRS